MARDTLLDTCTEDETIELHPGADGMTMAGLWWGCSRQREFIVYGYLRVQSDSKRQGAIQEARLSSTASDQAFTEHPFSFQAIAPAWSIAVRARTQMYNLLDNDEFSSRHVKQQRRNACARHT